MPSLLTAHPYKGLLYLAKSPGMEARGWLKVGGTSKSAKERQAGHAGQLSLDKSTIFHVEESLDWPRAEALALELLRRAGLLVQGRKEIILGNDLPRCVEILKTAVTKASVRTATLSASSAAPPAPRWQAPSEAWQALLSLEIRVGTGRDTLGNWMVKSLTDASVAQKLKTKGILCSYWHSSCPEFQLQRLEADWLVWLQSKGFCAQDLIALKSGNFGVKLQLLAI